MAWGGHLVTINNQAEQDWLAATFPCLDYPWLFIGLNDIAEEGTWAWVSGEPVTYINWGPGGNDDNAEWSEDVVIMNWGKFVGWG